MRNSLSCSQVQQDNSHHTMNRPKWSKLWDVAACCCTSMDTTLRLDGEREREREVQESAPFESFLGLEPFPKIRAFLQSPRSNSTCTATQSGSLAEHPGVHGSGAKHQNAFFEGRRGGSICRCDASKLNTPLRRSVHPCHGSSSDSRSFVLLHVPA